MNTAAQIKHFHTAPIPGDIDLISAVRDLLCGVGLKQEVLTHYDTNPRIMEAHNKPSDVQRYFLNRYLHDVFIQATVCTVTVRSKLIANAQARYWLEVFTDGILPFIIEHAVPLGYTSHE